MDELIGRIRIWGEEFEFKLSGWHGENRAAVDLFDSFNADPFDQYEPDPLGAIVRRIADMFHGEVLFIREPEESKPGVIY